MRSAPLVTDSAPCVSFVIPVLNEAARLPELLTGLRRDFSDCELIVVDGGSTDESVALAMPLADSVLLSGPGRARQMNLGAACARGKWLGFLHADTEPDFDKTALLAALNNDLRWAFCRVSLRGQVRGLGMVSTCMNQRSALTRIATGDQLLCVQRSVFEEIHGFCEIPLMEDVEICKRLRKHHRGGPVDLRVVSSGRRWEQQGLWRTIVRMWGLRLAYYLGVSPTRLWAHYYGKHSVLESRTGQ